MGGGTCAAADAWADVRGPSPRGRGNLGARQKISASWRAIPAWAGEPGAGIDKGRGWRGHPRVGGGTFDAGLRTFVDEGPSPRGRGNPDGLKKRHPDFGAIPAWAGEPRCAHDDAVTVWGHPRVGGGTAYAGRSRDEILGPSPRGRGNHLFCHTAFVKNGAIPAWAGEPSTRFTSIRTPRGHPRVGGGT